MSSKLGSCLSCQVNSSVNFRFPNSLVLRTQVSVPHDLPLEAPSADVPGDRLDGRTEHTVWVVDLLEAEQHTDCCYAVSWVPDHCLLPVTSMASDVRWIVYLKCLLISSLVGPHSWHSIIIFRWFLNLSVSLASKIRMQVSTELTKAPNKCFQGVIPYVFALYELFSNLTKCWGGGRWDGSAGKAACSPSLIPEFESHTLKTEGEKAVYKAVLWTPNRSYDMKPRTLK